MALTSAQTATLKADIIANQAANRTAKNSQAIADYYNASAGTGFIWRSNIPVAQLNTALVGTEMVARSAQALQLFQILTSGQTVDATNANVQGSFAAALGNPSTSLTNATAVAQRVPTRLEALFAVSNVTPANIYGYTLSTKDVADAVFNDDGSLK